MAALHFEHLSSNVERLYLQMHPKVSEDSFHSRICGSPLCFLYLCLCRKYTLGGSMYSVEVYNSEVYIICHYTNGFGLTPRAHVDQAQV